MYTPCSVLLIGRGRRLSAVLAGLSPPCASAHAGDGVAALGALGLTQLRDVCTLHEERVRRMGPDLYVTGRVRTVRERGEDG